MFLQEYVHSISQSRSPKRGAREKNGVAAWHAYYAGYSEAFVEDALQPVVKRLGQATATVLDPWNGSGTTTMVAQRLGLQSWAVEINPVMVIFAKAKCLSLTARESDIRTQCETAITLAEIRRRSFGSTDLGELEGWVPEETLKALIALRDALLQQKVPTSGYGLSPMKPGLSDRIKARSFYDGVTPFLLAALFRVLRAVGGFGTGSNPTWILKDESKPATPPDVVFDLFREYVGEMYSDLARSATSLLDYHQPRIVEGSSKLLPIPSNSIDLVVTSPPYCTRIDYAVATKPELLFLGLRQSAEFAAVRRSTMGAPLITGETIHRADCWGELCLRFLSAVENHPSKAARSHYLSTFLQYFRDAERSVREILRVLKPGGIGSIVVQSSYFKEVEIPLGPIYVQMIKAKGHFATVARREVVRQHMAHVNTGSSKYKADKVFYEDVVVVCKLRLKRRYSHLYGRYFSGSFKLSTRAVTRSM